MQEPDTRLERPIDAAGLFEDLFRAHYAAVVSHVRRRAPAASVDDVVAETFLVAWRRLQEVPPEPLPWLLAVARNVMATWQRSGHRRLALRLRMQSAAAASPSYQPEVEQPGPVAAALAKLSEKDREALTLIAWEELRPSEAAVVLGESAGTFRVRLHRAKHRLRQLLDQPGGQVESSRSHSLEAKETVP